MRNIIKLMDEVQQDCPDLLAFQLVVYGGIWTAQVVNPEDPTIPLFDRNGHHHLRSIEGTAADAIASLDVICSRPAN